MARRLHCARCRCCSTLTVIRSRSMLQAITPLPSSLATRALGAPAAPGVALRGGPQRWSRGQRGSGSHGRGARPGPAVRCRRCRRRSLRPTARLIAVPGHVNCWVLDAAALHLRSHRPSGTGMPHLLLPRRRETRRRRPPSYRVMLHNDNYNRSAACHVSVDS